MATETIIQDRINCAENMLKLQSLDAVIIHSRPNTYYFSKFSGTFSIIIISLKGSYFFTDSRYILRAEKDVKSLQVKLYNFDKTQFIEEFSKKQEFKNIGYENSITMADFEMLKELFPKSKWVDFSNSMNQIRMIKDKEEIKLVSKAAAIADKVMVETAGRIKPGISEKETAVFIKRRMEELGAEGESFPCIVASGKNSAVPHAEPSLRKFKKGDFITIDLGAKYRGYCSDMTRTFVLGKASAKQREIYETVKIAQAEGVKGIQPGIEALEIDKISRGIITTSGYGENFLHGTGHGVGIEIHEAPRVNRLDKTILQEGMIITVEPGIYIKNFGGVRIEDLVLVTETGAKILSKTNKNLIEIG